MNTKIKYIIVFLFLARISSNLGLAENGVAEAKDVIVTLAPAPNSATHRSLPDLGASYLILTPKFANATLGEGTVTIPFIVKNNSNKDIEIELRDNQIDGLAIVDKDGKKRFIGEVLGSGWGVYSYSGPGPDLVILKPGEITSRYSCICGIEVLGALTGQKLFGVISGHIANTEKKFRSYSAPFLIPPALTTLPYNDLGTQSYLSITPDLTKIGFTGGTAWIPLTATNSSGQDAIVVINDVDFYIAGDESFKQERMQYRRWEYLKASTPILKPGESISSESTGRSYITLSWLYQRGYKPGDKIIAIVGGRIPGTNNIFECYSAPFELPPLPKGQPPIPAGKQ